MNRTHHQLEAIRAINAGARGQSYRGMPKRTYGKVITIHGHTVYAGRPNLPFSCGTKPGARLTHMPTVTYTAWCGGRVCGRMVRWKCGATSNTFRLLAEPVGPICRLCALYAGGISVTVVIA